MHLLIHQRLILLYIIIFFTYMLPLALLICYCCIYFNSRDFKPQRHYYCCYYYYYRGNIHLDLASQLLCFYSPVLPVFSELPSRIFPWWLKIIFYYFLRSCIQMLKSFKPCLYFTFISWNISSMLNSRLADTFINLYK